MKKILIVFGIIYICSTTIVFALNSPLKMIVGYKEFFSETPPTYFKGQAFLPLRNLAEEMGYKVIWKNEDKRIALYRESGDFLIKSTAGKKFEAKDMFIELKIDEKSVKKNNKIIELSFSPCLINNNTYIPFSFIEEVFDWDIFYSAVGWDNKPTVWITPFRMLVEEDYNLDIKNFEIITTEGEVEYCLKKTGATWRGIKLGDSVEKLIDIYGIPFTVEKGEHENLNYKYTSAFIPESEAFLMYVFEVKNNKIKGLKIWMN